eukprot:987233-Amphidinium_carterae.1
MSKRVCLVRHGESAAQAYSRRQRWRPDSLHLIDAPLGEPGEMQASHPEAECLARAGEAAMNSRYQRFVQFVQSFERSVAQKALSLVPLTPSRPDEATCFVNYI